jgi:hypothetical protein
MSHGRFVHAGAASGSYQAEGFATAPQGNVTQASHKYVTKQNLSSPNATRSLNSGEAEQS